MNCNTKTIIVIWVLFFALVACNETIKRDYTGYKVHDAETLINGTDTIILTVSEKTEIGTHFRVRDTL